MNATDKKGFPSARAISTPSLNGAESAAFRSLSIDADSRLVILYELYLDYAERPRGLAINISPDGSKSFTAPAFVLGSRDANGGRNGSHQGLLMTKRAVNRDGKLAIVNSSPDQSRQSHVWLIRGEMERALQSRAANEPAFALCGNAAVPSNNDAR